MKVEVGGEKVVKVGLIREEGFLYWIDKEGDISRLPILPSKKKKKHKEDK